MLNSGTEVFAYRHLIIKTPCLMAYLINKHFFPKYEDASMTFRASFQYFLWGFGLFNILPFALAPILFHIPVSLFIQLLSEQRPKVTSVPLCL